MNRQQSWNEACQFQETDWITADMKPESLKPRKIYDEVANMETGKKIWHFMLVQMLT